MLTARTDEVDFVVGLDAGADDYVGKPFRLAELLARVRALLRRRAPEVIDIGGVRMETAARRVLVDGSEISLANKEFELLRVLMSHAGQVVTREEILAEVWNDPGMKTSKTLDMHMSWLRRKLAGPDSSGPGTSDRHRPRGRIPIRRELTRAAPAVRRRVLISILLVIGAMVLTLGVPLAIVSWRLVDDLVHEELSSRLQSIAASITAQTAETGDVDLHRLEVAVPADGRLEIRLAGRDRPDGRRSDQRSGVSPNS